MPYSCIPPWEQEVAPFCPYDNENLGHDGYHSRMCLHRRFPCPYDQCGYHGHYNSKEKEKSMYEHLRVEHKEYFPKHDVQYEFLLDGVTEPCDRSWFRFFRIQNNKYMTRISKKSSTFSFDVQLIGRDWETLQLDCSISLWADKDGTVVESTWGGAPRSIREEPDECLELSDVDVAPFVYEDSLKVIIAIKTKSKKATKIESTTKDESKFYTTISGRKVKKVDYNVTGRKNSITKAKHIRQQIWNQLNMYPKVVLKRLSLSVIKQYTKCDLWLFMYYSLFDQCNTICWIFFILYEWKIFLIFLSIDPKWSQCVGSVFTRFVNRWREYRWIHHYWNRKCWELDQYGRLFFIGCYHGIILKKMKMKTKIEINFVSDS